MKYLNSEEYNSIVLAIHSSVDYRVNGNDSKEKFYKTLFDKLFRITEDDLLKKETVNYPITNS